MHVRLPSPRALLVPLGLAGISAALCLPAPDGARGQGARPQAKKEGEAPKDSKDKAVADGLRWLALHQGADGRWSLNHFNRTARTAPLPGGPFLISATAALRVGLRGVTPWYSLQRAPTAVIVGPAPGVFGV